MVGYMTVMFIIALYLLNISIAVRLYELFVFNY
jgi:hypothetical protein